MLSYSGESVQQAHQRPYAGPHRHICRGSQSGLRKAVCALHGESSADIRRRAQAARDIQQHRFSDTAILNNAEMNPNEVYQLCEAEDSA